MGLHAKPLIRNFRQHLMHQYTDVNLYMINTIRRNDEIMVKFVFVTLKEGANKKNKIKDERWIRYQRWGEERLGSIYQSD